MQTLVIDKLNFLFSFLSDNPSATATLQSAIDDIKAQESVADAYHRGYTDAAKEYTEPQDPLEVIKSHYLNDKSIIPELSESEHRPVIIGDIAGFIRAVIDSHTAGILPGSSRLAKGGVAGHLWCDQNDEMDILESEFIDDYRRAVGNLYEDIKCLKESLSIQSLDTSKRVRAVSKLNLIQLAGCTCCTKTNEIKYHDKNCKYRLAGEVIDILQAPTKMAHTPFNMGSLLSETVKELEWLLPSALIKNPVGSLESYMPSIVAEQSHVCAVENYMTLKALVESGQADFSAYVWRPISTLPWDQPDLVVTVFADYTDEQKSIEISRVCDLVGFEQFSHWMPALPLPKNIGKWCDCDSCASLKASWLAASGVTV